MRFGVAIRVRQVVTRAGREFLSLVLVLFRDANRLGKALSGTLFSAADAAFDRVDSRAVSAIFTVCAFAGVHERRQSRRDSESTNHHFASCSFVFNLLLISFQRKGSKGAKSKVEK